MKLFDKICREVERFKPESISVFKNTKLFQPIETDELDEDRYVDDPFLDVPSGFKLDPDLDGVVDVVLPFDNFSFISSEDATHGGKLVNFVTTPNSNVIQFSYFELLSPPKDMKHKFSKVITNINGFVEHYSITNDLVTFELAYQNGAIWNLKKRGLVKLTKDDDSVELVEVAKAPVVSCLQILRRLADSSRFIVQQTTKNPRPRKTKIPRLNDRPTYTILDLRKIRELTGLARPTTSAERASPAAHWRRAHTRTLRSDRYVNAKGKTIHIPARWIGPEEAKVGNKFYKVLLDSKPTV